MVVSKFCFGDCVSFHSLLVDGLRMPCMMILPLCIIYAVVELNHPVHPASHSCPRDSSAPDASLLNRWTVLYFVGMVGRLSRMAV